MDSQKTTIINQISLLEIERDVYGNIVKKKDKLEKKDEELDDDEQIELDVKIEQENRKNMDPKKYKALLGNRFKSKQDKKLEDVKFYKQLAKNEKKIAEIMAIKYQQRAKERVERRKEYRKTFLEKLEENEIKNQPTNNVSFSK